MELVVTATLLRGQLAGWRAGTELTSPSSLKSTVPLPALPELPWGVGRARQLSAPVPVKQGSSRSLQKKTPAARSILREHLDQPFLPYTPFYRGKH